MRLSISVKQVKENKKLWEVKEPTDDKLFVLKCWSEPFLQTFFLVVSSSFPLLSQSTFTAQLYDNK